MAVNCVGGAVGSVRQKAEPGHDAVVPSKRLALAGRIDRLADNLPLIIQAVGLTRRTAQRAKGHDMVFASRARGTGHQAQQETARENGWHREPGGKALFHGVGFTSPSARSRAIRV